MKSNEKDDNRRDERYSLQFQSCGEEIRFLKKQQWRVTNYGMLLNGAIVGIATKLLKENEALCLRYFLILLAVLLAGGSIFILCNLEKNIEKRRDTLEEIKKHFKMNNTMESEKRVYWLLNIVLIFGAVLTIWLNCIFLKG